MKVQSHGEVGMFFGTNRTIMEVMCVYNFIEAPPGLIKTSNRTQKVVK